MRERVEAHHCQSGKPYGMSGRGTADPTYLSSAALRVASNHLHRETPMDGVAARAL